MVATAMSGTATYPIEAKGDKTHLILQRHLIESRLMCIGDTNVDDNQVQSHLLSAGNDMLVVLSSPPPISIPHSN